MLWQSLRILLNWKRDILLCFCKFGIQSVIMKNTLIVLLGMLVLSACKKDEFESTPQIEFVDISPNVLSMAVNNPDDPSIPKLILEVTDAEGDFGGPGITDSSWIFIKNTRSGNLDSFRFPNLDRAPKKDFKAEVSISLYNSLECFSSAPPSPRLDSSYFEVYVTDSKNHKSNVITTPTPAYRECP